MPAKPPAATTEANEQNAWLLRQTGWTYARIAGHLNIDESTAWRMCQRKQDELAKAFPAAASAIKAEQTALLDYIRDEALQEWQRSKQDATASRKTTKTVEKTNADGDTIIDKTTTAVSNKMGRLGADAMLARAMAAMADVRAIWGLDEPRRPPAPAEGAGGDGGHDGLAGLSEDEIDRRLAEAEARKAASELSAAS